MASLGENLWQHSHGGATIKFQSGFMCTQNSHIRVLKLDKIVINNLIIIFNE